MLAFEVPKPIAQWYNLGFRRIPQTLVKTLINEA